MTTIRRATAADIPVLARTLAAAFSNYAWTRWSLSEEDHVQRLEGVFALDLTHIGIPLNEVWTTERCTAVAVWIPPKDSWPATIDWERHTEETTPLIGDRLERADAAEKLLNEHRPKVPSWYLVTAGVHPNHQRQGLGSAVLRPVLDRCDRVGMPCMTETSAPENLTFYRRLGFEVTTEVAMPDDGPPVWIMWRDPR